MSSYLISAPAKIICGIKTTGIARTAVLLSLTKAEMTSPIATPLIVVRNIATKTIQNTPRTERSALPSRVKRMH